MLVVFDSLTGQGERFASRLNEDTINILDYNGEDDELFLVTRSWDFGKVTDEAIEFLDQYANKVVGMAVSGNRNWGTNYGAAGDKIHAQYGVKLVLKFEGSGFSKDVEYVQDWIHNYKEGNV
ncbi:class Ib ribonucleoside-diphosphate reductase assembly flavoprotein NrdI [Erysipelothrix sp. HDW6C]|uniref:class Ib ribonucleoside-diphosphate reductase assembly flavoprotein NrdI n=1 Tax=Erysipelothrix sp. HDW6C TaxID=2714930 RepID=UPI00140883D2|nr:class Ib ribonucleoside-diphosphate reductase assembly flavoprotein NrdI [Erysipelothrix sp. HDW6C]QIK69698.1 class Ib ribonucleoside-diphosphate reductase assembly flavoprotein NrdI [Erysipelothrix sp. HDW6C]